MRRRFNGRKAHSICCPTCGERCYLYSWSEADHTPAGRSSVRTYVYVHESTGSIDKRDEASGVVHYAPEPA